MIQDMINQQRQLVNALQAHNSPTSFTVDSIAALTQAIAGLRDLEAINQMQSQSQDSELLLKIGRYLNTVSRGRERSVSGDGELLGFWQTPEWIEGLDQLAHECVMAANQEGDRNG